MSKKKTVPKEEFNMGDIAVLQSLEGSAVPVNDGSVKAVDVLAQKMTEKRLNEAQITMQEYKSGKANLDARVIDNQEWYKLRQWEILRRKEAEKKGIKQVEPVSGWLFNSIANKHAVAMDNFPRANVLPREANDQQEAKMLTSILPVIMDQCEFEQVFSDEQDDKLINGGGIYGVFWNSDKLNGLGDIDIKTIDVLNLLWQPGIQNIQDSRNVFHLSLMDNDLLIQKYPQLDGKLGSKVMNISEYIYDDTVDTSKKSILVDWYYKQKNGSKTILHYCQFIMGQTTALYCSEDDPERADRGWYDDGNYPFVFDPMYKFKGTPYGFGYVDLGKSAQEYIDRGEQAIQSNMLFNAKPRHFIRSDGSVNEEEYADSTKDFVHVDGALGTDSVMPIQTNPLGEIYITILNNKINELKETTGNRDVSTGGVTGGATAASAVAAMQEAGAKLDRDNNKASYRAVRKVYLMCIERIRQFYDLPRYFRILGDNGAAEFVSYSNAGIAPQAQGDIFGVDMGYRIPYFDIEISAEKATAYNRMSQNELALQFYSAGFFAPQNAPAALACLNMMDFDRKDNVMQIIAQNGTLQSMLMQAQGQALQMAQLLDASQGSSLAPQLQAQFGMQGSPTLGSPDAGKAVAGKQEALGGNNAKESSITENARRKVAESTAPN